MTAAEQVLADDKARAEIAKLIAETAKINDDLQRSRVEVNKLLTEARQIKVNTFLAPFLAAAAVIGATATLIRFVFP